MSDSPADRRHRVVHLASGARHSAAPVSAVIASSGLPSTEVFDVYAALALIARGDRRIPMTIVACLDELFDADLEFFQLLRREHSAVTVFTYADARRSDVLARLQSEGTSSIDALATHLARVAEAVDETSHTRRSPSTRAMRRLKPRAASLPTDAFPQSAVPPASTASLAAPSAPAPPQPGRQPSAPEASASSRSRVPWMRYNDLPRRTPPRVETAEPKAEARSEPRGDTRTELRLADLAPQPADDEPLLTAEELNALLGEVGASGGETRPAPPRAWP